MTDEEYAPRGVPPLEGEPPYDAEPDDERAWWDLRGIDIPATDYQPLRETLDDSPDVDRDGAGLVSALQAVAEPVANVVSSVLAAAGSALTGETATRQRRLQRLNRTPLANLYTLHPEARDAAPRELGMRFVRIEEITGTAVAGADQRGGDFLPLAPFRGTNWEGRWQRIKLAIERLESLPPVDLVKFAGEYWVIDGHNRVAAALYTNGVGVDAMVTELLPLDGRISEQPTALLPLMDDSRALRAAGRGLHPAFWNSQALPTEDRAATDDAVPDGTAAAIPPSRSDDPGTRR